MPVNGFWFKRKGRYVGKTAILIMLKRDEEYSHGSRRLMKLSFQEKLLKICYRHLYRKPTQVVEERILR